jgi:hypothetical protein
MSPEANPRLPQAASAFAAAFSGQMISPQRLTTTVLRD